MKPVIEMNHVSVEFSDFALRDISLTIPHGVVVGLIGRNGAGKSTLIRTLCDIYVPTEGTILYDGQTMAGHEAEIKARLGIVYDNLYYPANKKASRVARWLSPFYPDFDMDRWHALMEHFHLPENKELQYYSKGMKVKYMISLVLARSPELLILDEPTSGMDPAARADFLDLLRDFMQDEEKSVLFSTHITSDLEKIADYIAIMDEGRLLCMEEKETLLSDYAVVQGPLSAMTDELRALLLGPKENMFGFVGLTREPEKLAEVPGLVLRRPSLEDLLIYGDEHEA